MKKSNGAQNSALRNTKDHRFKLTEVSINQNTLLMIRLKIFKYIVNHLSLMAEVITIVLTLDVLDENLVSRMCRSLN